MALRLQLSLRVPGLLLFLAALLLFGSAPAQAEKALFWIPADAEIAGLSRSTDLYYDGLAGRLVGAAPEAAGRIERQGGVAILVRPAQTLWVYLIEDANRAAFEPEARILVSAGHEVLIATEEPAPPRLTSASAAALAGLKQPVRIDFEPIPWVEAEVPPPGGPLLVDPVIQEMVDGLTQESYVTTWQTLDDFETRYVYASQNELATQWILDQFRSFGLQADFHYYEQSGQRRNVIATLPGIVDPTKVVYICGHLDAISDTPYVCAPGADDNATGTTGVIEAARVMSQYLFQYTIKFAAFNGEEQGLVGSDAYVAYIASQGENVIAAYNCDMIGYRGTDPAPADLVIYTNAASQSLSTTLSNAITTYLPGVLDPIVHVEALNASDHASFWARGYKAICSIEDEAWGNDFCPWYHTCNDRIEQYPHDYATNCAKANVAAVAMTALPISPEGSFLAVGSTEVDDDQSGGSNGNGDGAVNPGETIEFWVTVRNLGQAAATHVSGVLTTQNPQVNILNANAAWNDIPPSGQGTNLTAFRFEVSGTVADGELLAFTLAMTDDYGPHPLNVSLEVAAPLLSYRSHGLDDATYGNGNGVPDPGEVVLIPVTLGNSGAQDAANVTAILGSQSAHLTVLDGTAGNAMIPAGEAGALAPPYRVAVSPAATDGEELPMSLSITAGFGYATQSGFTIRVGSYFYDDVEAEGAWRLSVGDDTATTGRWVRADPIGTIQNGQPCQPEDDHTPAPGTICFVTGQGSVGGAPGEADVDGGKTTLTTPAFDLTRVVHPRVNYWRWYTNNLGNNTDDTWVVQISSNGGASWVDLERTTASDNSWLYNSFLVEGYITPSASVLVQFVASDQGGGSLVEAAIDDFEIEGDLSPVDAPDAGGPLILRLDPARPNPAMHGATISFAMPAPGQVSVRLYGVDGRLVRTLVEGGVGAGGHDLQWDGRNDAGSPAAPGIYFYKLRSGEREITRSLTWVK